jgi:hypothetical protein
MKDAPGFYVYIQALLHILDISCVRIRLFVCI